MTTANYLPRFSDPADIDEFVATLERFERGDINAEDFRRYRLTRGVYGQRQEGTQMLRVKIPQGVLAPAALVALARVAEDYAHGYGNVTTRQNVQFHFMDMADVEAVMHLLDEGGLTTREACGNTVRNITACPFAGVHSRETFDVAPYAEATTRFFLRRAWANSLPRKFKIAFSCGGAAGDCAMGAINDIGLEARVVGGRRGFRMTVAGGLSTSPQNGLLFHDFLPVEDLFDACEAVVRLFDRAGNRENKHRARLKYVLRKLGPETFLKTLHEEQAAARARGGNTLDLDVVAAPPAPPALPPPETAGQGVTRAPGYLAWRGSNTFTQVQDDYTAVVVRLPLGRVTAAQLRGLARLAAEHADGTVRTSIDQNLVLRFVPHQRLAALHLGLVELGLALPGARSVSDVTACPGAESCNLAVTSSRALATAITERLEGDPSLGEALVLAREATIKISGCPNSCGQHHIADLGFHGAARKAGDRTAPVYQLHLGGGFGEGGARFGRQVIKIPARRVPEAVARLLRLFVRERTEGEAPGAFFVRVPAETVTKTLGDLAVLDAATADETFLDIGQDEGFKIAIGVGECAA